MANVIDIIVSKQAQAELDKVIASLKLTHEEIIKINQQGLKINNGASPKNPQQMNNSVKETIALNEKSDATNKKLLVTAKQMEQASIKESNARNSLNKQREQSLNLLAKEEAKLNAASNLYSKIQAKINSLTAEYQNLAARKELGLTLTAKEEQRYGSLQSSIQRYDKTLKAVDVSMGKYQRNVGNYSGSFNPLSNSINQLTREMPAFTYSVQTGFMALSNNIPIFTDAISTAVKQNKELIAQGKPTTSVLSQLASSLFSFQTLLGVGITLLTVYGKEIGNWVSELWGASEALDELNKKQKEFSKTRIEGQKAAISERTELEKYKATMRNSNLPLEQRMIALQKLRNQYPFYFKNLKDEALLNGDISNQLRLLNSDLDKKNKLEKATEINVAIKQKLIDLKEEKKLLSQSIPALEQRVKVDKELAMLNPREMSGVLAASENALNKEKDRSVKINKEILAYEKEISKTNKVLNEDKTHSIRLEYTQEEQGNKKLARKKKEKELDEQLLFGTEAWLNAQISLFEETRSKTATTSDAYKEITGAIQYYQKWLETLTGTQKKANEEAEKVAKYGTIDYYEQLISALRKQQQAQVDNNQEFAKIESQIKFYDDLIKGIKGVSEATDEATKKNNDYFDSFVDTFSSESGFSKILDIARGNIEDFGKDSATTALAISEAFQEAFNTISQASQANFDAEYARLERQKEVALMFAGDSATAKEEIERQAEERRKQIARREAEAQKRLAIFNIVTNTAQAILATYAKLGFPVGVPASIAMGVIGAAQIAMVASQQIPQFFKGTENAPEGLAWTQEKGAEVITDKKGNVKTFGNNKGAQLTYLEKGDKVYKSQQDYINKTLVNSGIQPMRENNSLTSSDFNNGISKLAKTMQSNKGSNTQVFLNNKQINTDYFKGQRV